MMLTMFTITVKKRLISTSSSSATSTPANPPPPVLPGILLYKSPSFAHVFLRPSYLQMRWYRQANDREIREGNALHSPCQGCNQAESSFWRGSAVAPQSSVAKKIIFLSLSSVTATKANTDNSAILGSRRVGQGLIQICMGARQTKG